MAGANPVEEIQELQTLVVDYARQETVGPLKTLGRYLGLGLAGSVLISLGVFFIGLATLRLTQSLDIFSGGSWASMGPYGITIAVLILFMGLIYAALGRATKKVR